MLRPGLVVLVAFDPAAREELSLPDDVLAVHASWLAVGLSATVRRRRRK